MLFDIRRPSPNYSPVPTNEQLGVCFHHTVLSYDETLTRMMDPASRVSYHVIIAPDGTRCTLVADHEIAWHTGPSVFMGRSGCNNFLLGCAFVGDTYFEPLTDLQLDSAMEWLAPRWHKRGWTASTMTDHRQISPARKNDLNPVEWRRLIARIKERFPAA